MMNLFSQRCYFCYLKQEDLVNILGDDGKKLHMESIIITHFSFKALQLQQKMICLNCWEKIYCFNKFYNDVDRLSQTVWKEECVELQNLSENLKIENDSSEYEMDNIEHTASFPLIIANDAEADADIKDYSNEDKLIKQYCNLKCDYCALENTSFREILKHYKIKHGVAGYVECCGNKYGKRSRLIEHIALHINPQAYNCSLCVKNYSSLRSLNNHKIMSHASETLKKYKCDKCFRSYVKKYQLTKHKIQHIPEEEKKFICPECNKAFPASNMLRKHIKSVHEGANSFMCDICSKVLKSKQSFMLHRKEHEESCRVQCSICEAWLKNENTLRKHIKRHEEENMVFICDLCGKKSPNRHALQKHKSDLHIMQRVHKCNFPSCQKAFKRAIALKEHIATHTGEQLYSCLYCPKTFNSSANMHSHKKKVHRPEWEESRKKISQN